MPRHALNVVLATLSARYPQGLQYSQVPLQKCNYLFTTALLAHPILFYKSPPLQQPLPVNNAPWPGPGCPPGPGPGAPLCGLDLCTYSGAGQ